MRWYIQSDLELEKHLNKVLTYFKDSGRQDCFELGDHLAVLVEPDLKGQYSPQWIWTDGLNEFQTIGKVSELKYAEALEKALDLTFERFGDLDGSKTAFGVVAEEWLDVKLHQGLSKQHARRLEIFVHGLEREIGLKEVGQVNALLVKRTLVKVRKNPYHLRDLLSVVIQIMDLAVENGLIDRHGLYALKNSPTLPKPARTRGFKFRPLKEITTVLEHLVAGGLKDLYFHVLLLQALLCLRPGECIKLQVEWICEKTKLITIPRSEMKVKDPRLDDFRIPLSTQALNVIKRCLYLREIGTHSKSAYLFPGIRCNRHLCNDPLSRALRESDGSSTMHGFRKTARSWMAEKGVAVEVAAKCLDHELRIGADSFYQRSDLLKQRRKVMQNWGNAFERAVPDSLKWILKPLDPQA